MDEELDAALRRVGHVLTEDELLAAIKAAEPRWRHYVAVFTPDEDESGGTVTWTESELRLAHGDR